MIQFKCPNCKANLRVPDETAGKSGKCPKCGSRVIVPSPKDASLNDLAQALQAPQSPAAAQPNGRAVHQRATYLPKRASKLYYLGLYLGGQGFAIAAMLGIVLLGAPGVDRHLGERIAVALLVAALAASAFSAAATFPVLFYKMWAALQVGRARTTPGRAIGFLLIPVFNIWWAFYVFAGWAVDYNKLIAVQGIHARRASPLLGMFVILLGLAPAIVAMALMSNEVFLDSLIITIPLYGIPYVAVVAIFMAQGCDAINVIGRHAANPPPPR